MSCLAPPPEFAVSHVVITMRNRYRTRLVSEKERRKVWDPKSLRCFTCHQVFTPLLEIEEKKSGCNLRCYRQSHVQSRWINVERFGLDKH